jgi:predicted nucleic acid-binding protein
MLVDASVWIDHFRATDAELDAALNARMVELHPMVLGELALGMVPARRATLEDLGVLPAAVVVEPEEVLTLIGSRSLHGRGIGYVDAHLLASCLVSGATLWTHDRRLHAVAVELGVA